MDENLYLQCKKLKIDIDRNATNIKGCQVILNYLEKQKSNSIEYYELALDQLLFMMKSVHLEALDIRIGFSNYTYKKKYLDIISPILQMIDLSGSRRGFQGLRYLNILGNALNGTDVEIILDYNWDSETGQSSLSKLVMETLIENASYTEEELKRDLKSALVERYITGKILMDDTEPLIKKGRFELVYLWGNHIYDIPEAREIYFSRDLNISLLGDTFIIEKNPVYSEIPKAFFWREDSKCTCCYRKKRKWKKLCF